MNLIEILKAETETLKIQFIELTGNWACNEFKKLELVKEQAIINSKGFKNRSGNMEHTKASFSYWNNIRRIVEKGIEKFIADSKQEANEHYENSILKLSERIKGKELNKSSLEVKTSHIGVNIETTITDGTKTVRAFTIIAQGEIQRPHYRYLIK
jgi:hypothetical protein